MRCFVILYNILINAYEDVHLLFHQEAAKKAGQW